MTIQAFKYPSLHYLNQWLSYDSKYCEALSQDDKNNKLSALKNAASFYKVARNLPCECEKNKRVARYEPILDILDSIDQGQFQDNPVNEILKKILETEELISDQYYKQYNQDNHPKKKKVLSLTTKFLWLKIKQPIIIYDSRARKALETENGNLDTYDTYYKKWQEKFEKHQNEIKEACSKLPALHEYAVDQELGTEKYIKNVSSESWFHERVFDSYLWIKGNNT